MAVLKFALIGPEDTNHRAYLTLSALLTFVVTFSVYSVIGHAAGVLPAVVLGVVAALGIGYLRAGIVFAWLVTYGSLVGYTAVDVVSISAPLLEIILTLIGPESLTTAGVESAVLGVAAYAIGFGLSWGINSIESGSAAATNR